MTQTERDALMHFLYCGKQILLDVVGNERWQSDNYKVNNLLSSMENLESILQQEWSAREEAGQKEIEAALLRKRTMDLDH